MKSKELFQALCKRSYQDCRKTLYFKATNDMRRAIDCDTFSMVAPVSKDKTFHYELKLNKNTLCFDGLKFFFQEDVNHANFVTIQITDSSDTDLDAILKENFTVDNSNQAAQLEKINLLINRASNFCPDQGFPVYTDGYKYEKAISWGESKKRFKIAVKIQKSFEAIDAYVLKPKYKVDIFFEYRSEVIGAIKAQLKDNEMIVGKKTNLITDERLEQWINKKVKEVFYNFYKTSGILEQCQITKKDITVDTFDIYNDLIKMISI